MTWTWKEYAIVFVIALVAVGVSKPIFAELSKIKSKVAK